MSNLKILGAQRVKALTEMLKEQETAAIAEVNKDKLSDTEAEEIVAGEFGIAKQLAEVATLKKRLLELSSEIESTIGRRYSINTNYYYSAKYNDFSDRMRDVQEGDTKERIIAIKQEYKRKEQQLWLCETLEEAKAIVGI